MKSGAVVFVRGRDAKSRLGVAAGGRLADEARWDLIRALVMDVAECIGRTEAFDETWIGVPSEGNSFVQEMGLASLTLEGADANAQILSASRLMAARVEAYLLIGMDLPLLTPAYLSQLALRSHELIGVHGRGVVFGLSRGLGAAAILCAPPDVVPIVLDSGPTFLANRERLMARGVPYGTVVGLEGYFDLDTPADLQELALMYTVDLPIPGRRVRSWLAHHARAIASEAKDTNDYPR